VNDFQTTLDLLDAAEERHREEARDTTRAAREVTPEQRHERFAADLAARLRDAQSVWATFIT
jgi:hypothetical protein